LKKGVKYFENPPIYITTEANKVFAERYKKNNKICRVKTYERKETARYSRRKKLWQW